MLSTRQGYYCDRGGLSVAVCFFFFFFQAEDGIRDDLVTGVQTCALPIYSDRYMSMKDSLFNEQMANRIADMEKRNEMDAKEIGRASCRERV